MAPSQYIHHPKQSTTWSPGESQTVRDAYDAQLAEQAREAEQTKGGK